MAKITIRERIETLKAIRNGLANGSITITSPLLKQLDMVGVPTKDLMEKTEQKTNKVYEFKPNNTDKAA